MSAPVAVAGGVARWRVYLAERFPVPVTLMLAVATAAAAAVVGQPRTGTLVVDGFVFAGDVLLMFLLLFHLRVFDEHKDHALDSATRPDRPVQRGLITLGQLKVAGAIAIAAQAAIALSVGRAGLWWALPLGYSVLMLFEFGAPRWLERHYPVYAVSHSAITAVVVLAMVGRSRLGGGGAIDLGLVAGLALASTFSIDVLRKIYAPEHEVAGVPSWSKMIGIRRAGLLGAALLIVAGACAAALGWRAGGGMIWVITAAVVTSWATGGIRKFTDHPTPGREKSLQVIAGVHYLVAWTGILVAAAIARGATFVMELP